MSVLPSPKRNFYLNRRAGGSPASRNKLLFIFSVQNRPQAKPKLNNIIQFFVCSVNFFPLALNAPPYKVRPCTNKSRPWAAFGKTFSVVPYAMRTSAMTARRTPATFLAVAGSPKKSIAPTTVMTTIPTGTMARYCDSSISFRSKIFE